MKPSGVGGMAVMEGVMMKNKDIYAVAVRKPNNEIAVEKSIHKDFSDKVKLFKLPIFRGMLAFVDSLVIGVKVLNYSASFFEEEEDIQTQKKNKKSVKKNENKAIEETDFVVEEVTLNHKESVSLENTENSEENSSEEKKEDKSTAIMMAFAVLISIVMSVALFMVLPVLLTNLISSFIDNHFITALIEGIVRLTIFIGYILLASRMPEIKRVFMYHGAEHKTINCLENGFELTVENVKWQTKQHKRCGTSFMILVILISLVFFMLLPTGNLGLRVLSRVILVPFIAGVSYEFIRLAGKSDNKLVQIVSLPGLWMQGLTTKEPDDAMIEVAIKSVGEVFDWRTFLETSATSEPEAAEKTSSKKQEQTAKKKQTVKSTAHNKGKAAVAQGDNKKHNINATVVGVKPAKTSSSEEEDDEILKALDKYFDKGSKESNKSGES